MGNNTNRPGPGCAGVRPPYPTTNDQITECQRRYEAIPTMMTDVGPIGFVYDAIGVLVHSLGLTEAVDAARIQRVWNDDELGLLLNGLEPLLRLLEYVAWTMARQMPAAAIAITCHGCSAEGDATVRLVSNDNAGKAYEFSLPDGWFIDAWPPPRGTISCPRCAFKPKQVGSPMGTMGEA